MHAEWQEAHLNSLTQADTFLCKNVDIILVFDFRLAAKIKKTTEIYLLRLKRIQFTTRSPSSVDVLQTQG